MLCYHCFISSVSVIFPKCKLNSAKHLLKCYHVGLPRLKGGFSGLRCLSDSQVIPLQIPMALYQTRRNGVTREEQYQVIQQNLVSLLYKYIHLEKQTIMQHLLQAFLPKHFMVVQLNRAMIVLCHRFCFLILSQILLISKILVCTQ